MKLIYRGLKGITCAETAISHIDGEKGHLIYRGYDAKDIAPQCSFEEAAYLILNGTLPDERQLLAFQDELAAERGLPQDLIGLLETLPDEMDDMAVLRTAISGLGTDSFTYPPQPEEAIKLIAVTPTIIAYRYRRKKGLKALSPEARYGHVENYLYMLTGRQPSAAQKKALETYMILAMEHGMNTSTFSARVTVSTESDLVSAVTSALGTMKGPACTEARLQVSRKCLKTSAKKKTQKPI